MFYIKCPSCKSFLGSIMYEYTLICEEINKKKITDEEKNEEIQKYILSLKLNYCCNIRLLTNVNYHEILNITKHK